ncbi:protein ZINC INDUCED FACILITATOR-LIKE 1 [Oryza sativa Japonica Group]|uniref:protein ZINC INDUCED FACILITATOR-LIKE 1 n=1 Tax=Oryza sativa subsp. japonica TaxID=39947 RepID=UPI00339CE835
MQQIRDMNIAKREEDIGFYAGFVAASYFLARTFSSVPWGIFADKYGRKPCIVISILSVIFFNTLFGLSTRYWMAIVTRGMLGMLCGILGPIKAYATEICRKEHQALGMSLVTSSRAVAFVLGPAIGGFLAQPAEKYPHIFSKESIFGR